MRVLVTGSRDWWDTPRIYRALGKLGEESGRDSMVLIHGGAVGADTTAANYAGAMDWGVEVYRPMWAVYGKGAGIRRNIEMVDSMPDLVLAFIKDCSPGASQCADYAESKGIPVKRYLA